MNDEELNPFNHFELAGMPSYHALREAMNDLANETGWNPCLDGMTITEFLKHVRDMAMTVRYGDFCDRCFGKGSLAPTRWPHRIQLDEHGGVLAHYRCRDCGNGWTCGWALAPAFSGSE